MKALRHILNLTMLLTFMVMVVSGCLAFFLPFSIKITGLHLLTGFLFLWMIVTHLRNKFEGFKFCRHVLVFISLALTACGGVPTEVRVLRGSTMGTNYMLKCAATSEHSVHIDRDVQRILEQFDAELSNWNPDSWVSRFNRSESTAWQDTPESIVRILEQSKAIHALSGGAFDVTISPLIELWGFGADTYAGVPDQSEVEEQLKRVGMDRLELDLDGMRIRKMHPDLTINCSAIAKGTAVDLIAEYLSAQGIERYLIEIGGEVRTGVAESDPDSWTIGIRKPEAGFAQLQTALELRTAAMATSGDYLNFTEVDGVRYAHIIDPETGRPVPHGLHSVTVIAGTCATADALATACLVMGSTEALRLIEEMDDVEAYLVETGSDGSIQVLETSGLSAYE